MRQQRVSGWQPETVDVSIGEGGPNVLVDLGFPNPDELFVKTKLAQWIAVSISDRGLNQSVAAQQMTLPQPKLSTMPPGQFRGISEDKMMRCLAALGYEVISRISDADAAVGGWCRVRLIRRRPMSLGSA